ncbi:MAG: helix-turn-helix transcriptional regulator [Treponema sp.]|nr:helix-turn-helix domain-containing protein [Spirochaetia bacterium]MDD7460220.1 helix-turn-helix transcriptional regulator [Spirochaetales bacterium]MDY5810771.1 helix-turn-helix transcriptional regulator [Treponema sp.]MEE1181046.1 helix-turn-helix transcriptional regulator [Treponema sp.]
MAELELKDRLSGLLSERQMSQKQLAEITNLTESAVSRYVKGDRVPKGAILLNIANALGSSTDYLLGLSNVAHPYSSEQELDQAFELIARNAKTMTMEEKQKFAKILFS